MDTNIVIKSIGLRQCIAKAVSINEVDKFVQLAACCKYMSHKTQRAILRTAARRALELTEAADAELAKLKAAQEESVAEAKAQARYEQARAQAERAAAIRRQTRRDRR